MHKQVKIIAISLCGILLYNDLANAHASPWTESFSTQPAFNHQALTTAAVFYSKRAFSAPAVVVMGLLASAALALFSQPLRIMTTDTPKASLVLAPTNPRILLAGGKRIRTADAQDAVTLLNAFLEWADKSAWPGDASLALKIKKDDQSRLGLYAGDAPVFKQNVLPDGKIALDLNAEGLPGVYMVDATSFILWDHAGMIKLTRNQKGEFKPSTVPALPLIVKPVSVTVELPQPNTPMKLDLRPYATVEDAIAALYEHLSLAQRALFFKDGHLASSFRIVTIKGQVLDLDSLAEPFAILPVPTASGTYRRPGLFGELEQHILKNLDLRQEEFYRESLKIEKVETFSDTKFKVLYRTDLDHSIHAYQFTRDGHLIIVLNRAEPLKRISQASELIYHEIREAFWMAQGLSREDAHILAAAEQRNKFSLKDMNRQIKELTPGDTSHLHQMSVEELESIVQEISGMRSRHHALLEKWQSAVDVKFKETFVEFAKTYENVFHIAAENELLTRRVENLTPKYYSKEELAQALNLKIESLDNILPELNQNRNLPVWFSAKGPGVNVERLDPEVVRNVTRELRKILDVKLNNIQEFADSLIQRVGLGKMEEIATFAEKLIKDLRFLEPKIYFFESAKDKARMLQMATAAHFLNNAAIPFADLENVTPGTVRTIVKNFSIHLGKYVDILDLLSNLQDIRMGNRAGPFKYLIDIPTLLKEREDTQNNLNTQRALRVAV